MRPRFPRNQVRTARPDPTRKTVEGSGTGEVENTAFWKTYCPLYGVKTACTYQSCCGLEIKVGPVGHTSKARTTNAKNKRNLRRNSVVDRQHPVACQARDK